MYSTTALVKNPKINGKLVGTHQVLDRAARKVLSRHLPRNKYFPTIREILYFEGMRGPDGLKRKSPDNDDPSHMFEGENGDRLFQQILDHHANLTSALKRRDNIRSAFEAAWLAHMITDGLTPAHHFPLSETKEELMSNKEFIKIFGEPVKGIMHGHSALETARNNWLYWGAGGHMSKHIAYEYGVAIIAAALPQRALIPAIGKGEFRYVDPKKAFYDSVRRAEVPETYAKFRQDGWTTDLALSTKNLLLPEIVRAIALIWYSAAEQAYNLGGVNRKRKAEDA